MDAKAKMTELGARWKALDAKKKAKFENMAKDGKEAKKAEAAKANADANPTKEASKEQPQKQQQQQKQPQGTKTPAEKRKNPAEDARFAHLAVSPGNLSKLLKAATKPPKVKVPAAGAGSGAAAAAGKKQRPPKKKDEVPKDNDDLMTVRCGGLVGSYIISEKMVLCDGKKMTPAKFEEKSGVKTRRWKRTIKVDPAPETGAKPLAIGDFFSMMGVDFDEATKQ